MVGAVGSMAQGVVAALVNLDHPAHFIQWGWFQISVANLLVIVLMLAVFAVALFVPFPKDRGDR